MNKLKIISILILLSLIFALIGAFLVWQQNWFNVDDNKTETLSFWKLIPELTGFNGERTYLLLFQNNLELRPSGGYIGSFGILKINNAKIVSFEIHDTNIFDGFGKEQTEPPEPIKNYLKIDNWQMRDGNWSPDFSISAEQVEYFYHLQGGHEEFNGIVGVNATVLPELLKLTGPIYLEEIDKTFKSEDVLYELEYEVEKGYLERGIDFGERKTVLKILVKETLKELLEKTFLEQKELKNIVFEEFDKKNIVLFLKNRENQKIISKLGWSGEVDKFYENDYLMIVEANLASKKSNAFIKREVEYYVDLTKNELEGTLKIRYIHEGKEKDWFNDDYRAHLRIYLPYESWILEAKGQKNETSFSKELGKTVFNCWIEIPSGQEKVIEIKYLLPERIKHEKEYKILIQKQIGVESIPFNITLKGMNQKTYIKNKIIEKDWEGIISFEK